MMLFVRLVVTCVFWHTLIADGKERLAFQAKILLLQCALHRLLRPHCVGWLTAKLVPWCTQKGRRQKNVKRIRAPRARIHLSHLYVFQGYIHFLQTLHSSGLRLDNHRGRCVGFGLKILHKNLHCVGFRGGVCRVVVKQKYKCRIGRNMQKRGFHPTFLLFEPVSLRKVLPTRHAVLLRSAPSFT